MACPILCNAILRSLYDPSAHEKAAALGWAWAVNAGVAAALNPRRTRAALRNHKKKRPENDTGFRTAFGSKIAPKSDAKRSLFCDDMETMRKSSEINGLQRL